MRKKEEVYALAGHIDTPTSLSLSPNGSYLLSPSFSSHTLIHDVRPFSPSPSRIHRVLQGAPAGFENTLLRGAWSRDDGGQRVAVGGADRMVCIWDVESARVLYKVCVLRRADVSYLYAYLFQLPGHKGTVTTVDFHPKEPISASRLPEMILPFTQRRDSSPYREQRRHDATRRIGTGCCCVTYSQ